MITESRTSCRKVCATHWIRSGTPPRIASGRLISATPANTYAHHIVPTALVIVTATAALNRVSALVRSCWSLTRTGRCGRRLMGVRCRVGLGRALLLAPAPVAVVARQLIVVELSGQREHLTFGQVFLVGVDGAVDAVTDLGVVLGEKGLELRGDVGVPHAVADEQDLSCGCERGGDVGVPPALRFPVPAGRVVGLVMHRPPRPVRVGREDWCRTRPNDV